MVKSTTEAKILSQQVKLEKAQLSTRKFEVKQKEKKAKKWQKLAKKLSKPIVSRRILKKKRPTLTIKQIEVPSILSDPNRFFKDEMEEAEMSMFLK